MGKFYESWIAFSWINFNRSYHFWWDELGDIKSASFFSSWGGYSFEAWSTIGPRLYPNWLSSCYQLITHLTSLILIKAGVAFNLNLYITIWLIKNSLFVFNSNKESTFYKILPEYNFHSLFSKRPGANKKFHFSWFHYFPIHIRTDYLADSLSSW